MKCVPGLEPFHDLTACAWANACNGHQESALKNYRFADEMMDIVTDEKDVCLNPSLSILRHFVGKGYGKVIPVTQTEDAVVGFLLTIFEIMESVDNRGMIPFSIKARTLEKNIRLFMDSLDLGHHPQNIDKPKPHIQVLSTGRCGTVSLYHLLKGSNLIPYHTYWWMMTSGSRQQLACQFDAGNFEDMSIPETWLRTRAAEWLSGTMIGLNHLDTIFAPAFAAMHEKSKFIYLTRNRVDTFKSFWTKDQWSNQQLKPVYYKFDPDWAWRRAPLSLPEMIAWYFKFTEVFSQAFGRVMGDRYIEISSDKLFAQDKEEIKRLLDFIGSDITVKKAVKHYGTKINEKKHKAVVALEPGLTQFLQAL
jgi:hypothetical protein